MKKPMSRKLALVLLASTLSSSLSSSSSSLLSTRKKIVDSKGVEQKQSTSGEDSFSEKRTEKWKSGKVGASLLL